MSLLDALLLDPQRIDTFVALRNDEVVGSGTQTDPFNASPRLDVKKGISSFTPSGTEALANSTAHGYSNNDVVVVSGATDPAYNGIFVIYGVATNSFKYQMDSVPAVGGGAAASAQKALELRFDTVMSTLVSINTCVHIRPGVIPTRGYKDTSPAWELKAGLRIVGSGIDVTRIKLMATATTATRCYAFGHALIAAAAANLVDFCEICDLTIHCGFTSANRTTTEAAGGVRMMGNYARVVRTKLTHWGCRNASLPMFGIALLTGNTDTGSGATDVPGVVNCGIQDCIVIAPQDVAEIKGPISLLHVGGPETATSTSTPAVGTSPYLRDCYVDCGQTTLTNTTDAKRLRALSMSWCRGGVVEGNQVSNAFYGGPYSETLGAYEIIVRNNVYRNVATGPCWQLSNLSAKGIQKLLIEGNVLELTAVDVNPLTTGASLTTRFALGIALSDKEAATTPFGNVVIRANVVRYTNGTPVSQKGSGILVWGATSLLVRENTFDLVASPPPLSVQTNMTNKFCASVQYFENRTPVGKLVQGFLEPSGPFYTELATDADDAFMLSLLRRAI